MAPISGDNQDPGTRRCYSICRPDRMGRFPGDESARCPDETWHVQRDIDRTGRCDWEQLGYQGSVRWYIVISCGDICCF